MAEQRVQRRLAAIMAADVVGYSRLMGEDETGTLTALKELRSQSIDPTIAEYEGRIVKLMGDGALVEFASVVDAVECAVRIQNEIIERTADLPDAKRIAFRIGVNLGDIIIEGDDIYGDGVNVAARLEGLAEPGGVCISGSAFEQVRDKLAVGYVDLGEQHVKNIERPVQAYRVLTDPTAAGEVMVTPTKKTKRWKLPAVATVLVLIIATGGIAWWQPWVPPVDPLPPPDNPSIAVLPFNNLSGDNFSEVILRNVGETLTAALSRLPDRSVIANALTLPYKNKTVDPQHVAEELGARYVLQGSVQQFGEQVRITAKLTDAQKALTLWGESYNRQLQTATSVQDEITLNVVRALEVGLVEEARARIVRGNTKNAEAYQLVQQGLLLYQDDTVEKNTEARRLFEKAVELDPNYSIGWHLLGYTYNASSRRGWREDRTQERARAIELARKALVVDASASGPHILLSTISMLRGNHTEAVASGEKAVAMAPNDAMTVAYLARIVNVVGQPQDALPLVQQAIRLEPYTPPPVLFFEGLGYHSVKQYDDSIDEFIITRAQFCCPYPFLALLAITSADQGHMDEARVPIQQLLYWNANVYGLARSLVDALDYKDRTKSDHALATLLQLGLPE